MQTEPQRDGQPVDPLVANLQRLEADSRDGAVQKDVLIAWDIENAQLPSNVPVAEVERAISNAFQILPRRKCHAFMTALTRKSLAALAAAHGDVQVDYLCNNVTVVLASGAEMEEQEKLQNDLSDIAAAEAESATAAEARRYFREKELLLRKEELLLLEKLPGAATASALPVQRQATPPKDPTAAYLEDCLKTPAGGRGALCQLLLHGNVEALRQCLATPVTPGLPLPPFAAAKDPRLLQHKLVVPATQQAAPDELAMHMYGAVCDSLTPAGAGCSSGMYTAFLTHRLLERTLWLIAKHRRAAWLEMDRNVAGASGAKVRLQRPDFMVWVKRALLFKGQEKADQHDLRVAVDELTSHTTEAWAAELMPSVQRPCMLAYAAAGSRIQFFCLKPTPSDNIGGGGSGGGRGSSTSSGSASRWHAHAEPISNVLDLGDWEGRLAAVTATFNIWRLLEDYAESGQPAPESAIGLSTKFARRHVTFHPGYVCKVIPHYRETHERYFGGDLQMISMEGYGTDAYLHLARLGNIPLPLHYIDLYNARPDYQLARGPEGPAVRAPLDRHSAALAPKQRVPNQDT